MVDTILLDFYGTIAVYEDLDRADRTVGEIIYQMVKSENEALDFGDFWRTWQRENMRQVPPHERVMNSVFLAKIMRVAKSCGTEGHLEEVCSAGEKSLAAWHTFIRFPEDPRGVLARLGERFRLGLVSNFDHPAYLRALLARLGIAHLFGAIVISGEVGAQKPSPEIFHQALTALGSAPGRTAFVGDSLRDDIEGARQVGCLPILIDMQDRFPDFDGLRIRSLPELLSLELERA
jgi:HAD superfamily hydrolase (TIGR01549 family)